MKGLNPMLGALGALAATTGAVAEGGGWVRRETAQGARQRRFRKRFHRAHMKR